MTSRLHSSRAAVADVIALLQSRTQPLPGEVVSLARAADRILYTALVSPINIPHFAKAAMDGFAVRAADTSGASRASPRRLRCVGEAKPGDPFVGRVAAGEAVRISTGAPVPPGADAVVMRECTQVEENQEVVVYEAVSPGKHILAIGEDVQQGQEVLPAGRRLRPQDLGLLAAMGFGTVQVVRQPQVAIVVTGNELVPAGQPAVGFQTVDCNSPMLAALVERDGGRVHAIDRVADERSALRQCVHHLVSAVDVILMIGGTSAGSDDYSAQVVAELGELPIHGVAVRPGAPVGIGWLRPGLPVFLLPGQPVACLWTYDLFAGGVIRRLAGRAWEWPYRAITRPLAQEILSVHGRVDYVRVQLRGDRVYPLNRGGASNLSTAVIADGFIVVPAERDRLEPGESVDVYWYDPA
ncbi:MAG: molybdopterin molybdotransferase MoeA [Gemmataceae bacterium]|nr:molybdopterin molybdotransferase MoeA [Gemmata sp.]MDW8197658.1 molybdopterin molybdotransferase MoeA [Gemmataceae bacterium]